MGQPVRGVPSWVWLLAPLAALLAVAYVGPLIRMVLVSIEGDALANYGRFWSSPLYRTVLLRTLRVAMECALLAVLIGYPLAAYVAGCRPPVRRLLLVVLFVPVWTSVVVRSYAWVILLKPAGPVDRMLGLVGLPALEGRLLDTETAILIGMVHVLLPYAVLPMYTSFRALDPTLLQAASSLGADFRRRWTQVVLPLTSAGAVAGGLLVFLLALGFFITPAILGGPRNLMLATFIGQQVRQFNMPLAAASSVVLLLGTFLVILAMRAASAAARRRGLA